MASMELSLDDIIKKNKISVKGKGGFKKFGGNKVASNRGNPQNKVPRRTAGVQQRKPGVLNAGRSKNAIGRQQPITDARNRIIQKKRLQLTDARDKLCELAKQTDVRLKLENLRETRLGHNGIQAHLGYNGYNPNIRKSQNPYGKIMLARTAPDLSMITLQRTISQPMSRYPPKVPALMDMDVEMSDGFIPERVMPLRRTVNNDQMRREPMLRPSKLSNPSPYSWKAPPQQRITQSNKSRGYIDLDYPVEERKRMKLPSPPPIMRPIVLSDDEDIAEPVRPIARSTRTATGSNMSAAKSRLESSRVQQSHPSSAGAGSSGYRIVVSNLQSSVTHEDIRELFEDIGPLVASRLVRPGTAEVVYRSYQDAERAVENYHNRQLDGQPMKCLLVKPRATTASSASQSSGNPRATSGPSAKLSSSGKSSVVPDINTIHKALFNKS
ncbi:Polymerase delta-interacting protein 3 [Frankliniella fusca]|uniref:Polymerase delta-interacting protein 3 n=1 Tax=Frankliniella fusca TaxID=407009 RepID=A0AAE1LUS9_9NEOP|nr:Polymerase delta-interacting protein 3 [Frankliniella fusca]